MHGTRVYLYPKINVWYSIFLFSCFLKTWYMHAVRFSSRPELSVLKAHVVHVFLRLIDWTHRVLCTFHCPLALLLCNRQPESNGTEHHFFRDLGI